MFLNTEDLKSAPGAAIFNNFSLNFAPNSIDFSSSSLQFPAAGSARWRLGARSALDNIQSLPERPEKDLDLRCRTVDKKVCSCSRKQ